MEIFFIVLVTAAFLGAVAIGLKLLSNNGSSFEVGLAVCYVVSLVLLAIGMMMHNAPWYQAIDPVDGDCYAPFSDKHKATLVFYFLAFMISLVLVWRRGAYLPPLTLVLSLVFILVGVVISAVFLLQLSQHDTSTIRPNGCEGIFLLVLAPVFSIINGSLLLVKTMTQQIDETAGRIYGNKYLQYINGLLARKSRDPLWVLLLLFPVLFTCTLILILFGQDTDSIAKIFTDTTTWKFSQQTHPPILEHHGHYLCTVAAVGDPGIVKPIHIGKRHGSEIMVNRQLQIANAFEELVQDLSPKLHHFIRRNYDRYGYDLSKKINTTAMSNLTYLLMKPLEWFFLICLYLFCTNPEKKISRQYRQ